MEEEKKETMHKICEQVEELIGKISEEGIQADNVELLGELVDIHKDIANEKYWDVKKEGIKMRYNREYDEYNEKADEAFDSAYYYEFDEDGDAISDAVANAVRLESAIWSAIIALMIGIFLGIGEGVFYGSAQKALLYAAVGALCSIVLGFISG